MYVEKISVSQCGSLFDTTVQINNEYYALQLAVSLFKIQFNQHFNEF